MFYTEEIVDTLKDTLRKKRLSALLVTDINNVRYLTGFTGSSGFCLITAKDNYFITDFRYTEQAGQEVSGWRLGLEKGKRLDTVKALIRSLGIEALGFEVSVSYEFYDLLTKLPVKLTPCKGLVESIRAVKNRQEIEFIREAYRRAERAFKQILPFVKAGVKESELALRLETALKREGCKKIPFGIIVASGPNSSMPHASVTDRRIKKGDLVTIDWGGEYRGYLSDITRTLLIKGDSIDLKCEIYNIVKRAKEKAIREVAIGKKAREIDSVARDYISDKGYGDNFGHGTGHGIGLQPHEEPRINRFNNKKIKDGMVFTIEPGIYISGMGGVRIEDTVALIDGKVELLNTLTTELQLI